MPLTTAILATALVMLGGWCLFLALLRFIGRRIY